MKNIHVLPTDKPSRLSINYQTNLLQLGLENRMFHDNINIYITSDEEIKEGDWCIEYDDIDKKWLNLYKPTNKSWDMVSKANYCRLKGTVKKIILTTDQDLIADGIQAIDDDFLEWFVKNPSCERVEVKDVYKTFLEGDKRSVSNFRNKYKIIIPKEEPKQKYKYIGECKGNNDNGCFMDSCGHNCGCFTRVLVEEPKQETLEEVNQSHVEQNKYMFIDKNFIIWLFNNYKKNNGTLFYHKFDNSNVKTYYYLEDLLKIYNEKS